MTSFRWGVGDVGLLLRLCSSLKQRNDENDPLIRTCRFAAAFRVTRAMWYRHGHPPLLIDPIRRHQPLQPLNDVKQGRDFGSISGFIRFP